MGLETRCEIRWRGHSWTAAVHLDSETLEVRGRPRLVLPLKQIRSVHPVASELGLETDDGRLTLVLGAAVPAWARKVQAPPSRLTKLGVGADQRVSLIGLAEPLFRAELAAAGVRLRARGKADTIFFGVEAPAELERLSELRERIEPDGAVWVVRVKGKAASVKENEVREAARAAGLVDVKVAAFSATHTAEKLVVPVAARQRPRAAAKRTSQPASPAANEASSPAAKKKVSKAGIKASL